MRGKAGLVQIVGRLRRITPACAGKRYTRCFACPRPTDYPRVCGEKKKMQPRKDKRMGSPPRVRGKAQESFLILCHHGITPACAGKRTVTTKEAFQKQDHPRVCGEKARPCGRLQRPQGSPPRVRGKVRLAGLHHLIYRITPACAGKRVCETTAARPLGDHPRVCGEKLFFDLFFEACRGSPPRVRGKVHGVVQELACVGITPACAGKRAPAASDRLERWDHPRVCGEKRRGSGPV